MSVSAVESTPGLFGAAATADATGDASKATTKVGSNQDKDMFLQLLVAQMRYQDPSNPTDTSQFLSQTAQFTSLEKMQDVADQTAQLVSAQMTFGATGLVGRTVAFPSADGTIKSGVVGSVTFTADGPMLGVGGEKIPMASVQALGDGTTDITAGLTPPAAADDAADPGDPADPA
jgi:flagellar basal-body rod modification protein FlgD